jgi:uncharacterized protein YndB with AHSA1/START domain
MDFSAGGFWKFTMHGPDGRDYKNVVQFLEINKPSSIVYKHTGEEDTEDIQFQTRVTFKEVEGGTYLEVEMEFPSREELDRVDRDFGAIVGAQQHLSRLGAYIDSMKKEKSR